MALSKLLIASVFLAALGTVRAATIIRANTVGANGMGAQNANVLQTFGDNISFAAPGNAVFETASGLDGTVGTPDIDLAWAAAGGTNSNAWQYHGWSGGTVANTGGGVLQMDGSSIGSTFSITFTPGTAATALVLNSFNFVGDTNNDTYQYQVDIVSLTLNAMVATSTTAQWTTTVSLNPGNTDPDLWAGAPGVALNFTGIAGQAYRLDLIRVGTTNGAGSNVDIAIDNLSFDQIQVPEPSVTLLGGLGWVMLRRRQRPS